MAYRSDLEAAHARLDAMGRPRPCPVCKRRERTSRLHQFAAGAFWVAFVALAAFGAFCLAVVVALATADFPRFG